MSRSSCVVRATDEISTVSAATRLTDETTHPYLRHLRGCYAEFLRISDRKGHTRQPHQTGQRSSLLRRAAAQQLIPRRRQRKQVRAGTGLPLTRHLLRRTATVRILPLRNSGLRGTMHRRAEIDERNASLLIKNDIGRLDIPVNNPLAMQIHQSLFLSIFSHPRIFNRTRVQKFWRKARYTLKIGIFRRISSGRNSTRPVHYRKLSYSSASA